MSKSMTTRDPDRVLPALLLALTAVTGFVDAVSYLSLGHVFTANMTGNVVFLGFALSSAPDLSVARSGAALAAFAAGALAGGRMVATVATGPRLRWASNGFAIEALLLLFGAAVAAGARDDLLQEPARLYALIVLTGTAMGVRNAVVRKLGERDLTTTVLTMTITGIAADSPLAGGNNPGWARRAASVALMFGGAAAGTWLLRHSLVVPIACAGAVSGICAVAARICTRQAVVDAPRKSS
jgi:uncharacterized membrane protein YoaK (UPF0700 family)